MKIAVPYDGTAHTGAPDVAGVLEAVEAVAAALTLLGHTPVPIPVVHPLDALLARLAEADLVFNLAESFGGRSAHEPRLARLMATAGPPLTGCPSRMLERCRRKDRLNVALTTRGLPVPDWCVAGPGERPAWSRYPAVVKPAGEDGSVGIDGGAVVEDAIELGAALDRASGLSLVQRFVGGREFNVGIVGNTVLPIAEIRFSGPVRVLTYAAKWEPGSPDDTGTRPSCPAAIPDALRGRIQDLGRRAWAVAGGRGYGRIDLRTDEAGRPFILEVNPNPDLSPGAGLARMAHAGGWSFEHLVDRIIEEATR
jgi:D-alanine-D-alanine ligase